jgi:hypothetical protein
LSIKNVIVDLESINPPAAPRESAAIIESLANSIIDLRGLLRPPVLSSVGIDEYELLAGQLEFYAYLQARKFDESLPDRLTAFVVDKKHQDAIKKQLITITNAPVNNALSSDLDLDNLAAKLERLFSTQQDRINALQGRLEQLIDYITPEPFLIFQVIDRVQEPNISVDLRSCLAKFLIEKPNAKNPKSKKIVDLLEKAKKKGIAINSFAALVDATTVDNNGKKIRVISNKTILEIIDDLDAWSAKYRQFVPESKPSNDTSLLSTSNSTDLQQLEAVIKLGFMSTSNCLQTLESSLVNKIDQSCPKQIDILTACNRINESSIIQQFAKKLAFLGDTKLNKIIQILQASKNKGIDINGFKSLQSLLVNPQTKTKILSDQKMIEAIDRWHQ